MTAYLTLFIMGFLDSLGKIAGAVSGLGPIASIGSAVIGGITGSSAQKSANKSNLQIAQETNQANRDIAAMTNQANLDLWREQAQYNSMQAQKERAAAAGFSPWSLLDSAGFNSTVSSTTGAPVVGNPMMAAQMMPVDALSRHLGGLSDSLANNTLALAQARKADAETKGQEIQNEYTAEMLAEQLRLMGYQNDEIAVKLSYLNQRESLEIDNLQKVLELTDEQISQIRISRDIQQYYKENIQPQEYQQLIASINKINEEGKTQDNLRNYYDAAAEALKRGADADMILAKVAQFKAPSEVESNTQYAANQKQQAALYKIQGYLEGKYGDSERTQRILEAASRVLLNGANSNKVWKENKKLQQDIDFATFDKLTSLKGTFFSGMFEGMNKYK